MKNKILKIHEYNLPEQLRPTTEIFFIKEDQVLLGEKLRGFGKGNFVGIGGKVEIGESIENAAIRESIEEINVRPLEMIKVSEIDFLFPNVQEPQMWNQKVHVYICQKWEGEPILTDEIRPKWFNKYKLPLKYMWSDAVLWIPKVLENTQSFRASFLFDGQEDNPQVLDYYLCNIEREKLHMV